LSADTLEPSADNYAALGDVVDNAPAVHSLGEHPFEIGSRHAERSREPALFGEWCVIA
jgi:hypothetical protein